MSDDVVPLQEFMELSAEATRGLMERQSMEREMARLRARVAAANRLAEACVFERPGPTFECVVCNMYSTREALHAPDCPVAAYLQARARAASTREG